MDDTFIATGKLLKRLERLKTAAGDETLAPLGLSMSLWATLRKIASSGSQSAHAMAEASFVTPQSFGELVQKLLRKGLIKKRSNCGRSIQYEPTVAGRECLEKAETRMEEVLGGIFSPLSAEELSRLREMLERIVDAAEQHKPVSERPAGRFQSFPN